MMHRKFWLLIFIMLSACSSTNTKQGTPPSKEEQMGTVYLEAGTDALMNGKYSEALSSLLNAVKYSPKSTSAWNNLGLAYAAKGENKKAQDCWLKALDIDAEFSDARSNLGSLYFSERKYAAAEAEFKAVLKDLLYTKAYQVNYNLALLYMMQGKITLAEQNLRLALQTNKAYCPAWESLGAIQKERGEIAEAINSWHNSVEGNCFNNPKLHFDIAGLYISQGDMAKAKKKYLEVIELFPKSDWAKKAEANLNLMRQ